MDIIYMYWPGIRGSVTDPKHLGWIELTSFLEMTPHTVGAGRIMNRIQIKKLHDASSPMLLSSSRRVPTVMFDFVRPGDRLVRLRVTLSDVAVVSAYVSGTRDLEDSLTLAYVKCEYWFAGQRHEGPPPEYMVIPVFELYNSPLQLTK